MGLSLFLVYRVTRCMGKKKYRKKDVLHYRYGWLCNYTSCYANTALQKLLGLLSTLFLLQIADPFAMA